VLVDRNYAGTVQLQSWAQGSEPLWMQIGDAEPTTRPVLEAGHTATVDGGMSNFPTYIFVPRAGCYLAEGVVVERIVDDPLWRGRAVGLRRAVPDGGAGGQKTSTRSPSSIEWKRCALGSPRRVHDQVWRRSTQADRARREALLGSSR